MVLLTVVTNSNPHTLYFDHPIEKPSSIRLLSASLYNSWHNLKKSGSISTLPDSNGSSSVIPFRPGHYTADSLAEEFAYIKQNKPSMDITVRINTPTGVMVMHNPKSIRFSANLVTLFGGENPALNPVTIIPKLNSPTAYFVHCDLMAKKQKLAQWNTFDIVSAIRYSRETLWKGSLPNTTTPCLAWHSEQRLWCQ